MPTGSSLEAVCQAIEQNPARGWGRRAALTVRRFGAEAKTGDFVWTRDTDAHYRLCRITGGYRFDASPAAAKVDSYQVRRVEWARAAFGDLDVPGAVVRGFVGSADSFSRIHDHSARMLTPYLWEKLHGREPPRLHVTGSDLRLAAGRSRLRPEIISSDDVLRMAREEPHVLPARIRAWFELASS